MIDFNAELARLRTEAAVGQQAKSTIGIVDQARQNAVMAAQAEFETAANLLGQVSRIVGDVPGIFDVAAFRILLSRVGSWLQVAERNRIAAQHGNASSQALLDAAVQASQQAALADVATLGSQVTSLKRALLRVSVPAVPEGCDDDDVADRKADIAAALRGSAVAVPMLMDQAITEEDRLSLAVLLGQPMRIILQGAKIDQQTLQQNFIERIFADAEQAALDRAESGKNLDQAARLDLARRGKGVAVQALRWFMPATKEGTVEQLAAVQTAAMARAEACYQVVYLKEADQMTAAAELVIRQA